MATLWKVDFVRCVVRPVEGDPYPGRDSEGDEVFDNTHFAKREDAMQCLKEDAAAGVCLAGREIRRLELALEQARITAGDDAKRFQRVDEYLRAEKVV